MKKIIINPKAARAAGWDKESLLYMICQLATCRQAGPGAYKCRGLALFPSTLCLSQKSELKRINNVINRSPVKERMFREGRCMVFTPGDAIWLSDRKSDIENPNYYQIDRGIFENVKGYLSTINGILDLELPQTE